jgi:hypothetical protein
VRLVHAWDNVVVLDTFHSNDRAEDPFELNTVIRGTINSCANLKAYIAINAHHDHKHGLQLIDYHHT